MTPLELSLVRMKIISDATTWSIVLTTLEPSFTIKICLYYRPQEKLYKMIACISFKAVEVVYLALSYFAENAILKLTSDLHDFQQI